MWTRPCKNYTVYNIFKWVLLTTCSGALQCSGKAEFHLPLGPAPITDLPGSLCTPTLTAARPQGSTDKDLGPREAGSVNQAAILGKVRHHEGSSPTPTAEFYCVPSSPHSQAKVAAGDQSIVSGSSVSTVVVKMRSCWSRWAHVQHDWCLYTKGESGHTQENITRTGRQSSGDRTPNTSEVRRGLLWPQGSHPAEASL